jgi:hypothetical protein
MDLLSILQGDMPEDHYESVFREIVADDITNSMEKIEFFIAPASTQHHHPFPGGLARHSLEVYYWMTRLADGFAIDVSSLDAKVAALFHDACKCGLYETYKRNVKNEETGKWDKVDSYKFKTTASAGFGHGGESLRRIERVYTFLNENWARAVYWHMGVYGLSSTDSSLFTETCRSSPEVLLLHTADMCSSVRPLPELKIVRRIVKEPLI